MKLVINDVLILHENTELLPYVDSYELSPGNNDPTEGIMLVLVQIPFLNQLGWVEIYIEN